MPRDSQPKMSNNKSTASKKREERVKNKKQIESSDSSDDTSASDDDSENEMDAQEYRKFLKGIFPSKHLSQKIKAGERIKKVLKDEDLEEEESSEEEENVKKCKKGKKGKTEKGKEKDTKEKDKKEKDTKEKEKKGKKGKKIIIESDDSSDSDGEDLGSEDSETDDSETEDSETEDPETEDSETDEDINKNKNKNKNKKDIQKPSKFNVVFTIGGLKKEEEDDDESDSEDWESCSNSESESDTENEDDPISDTDEDDDEEEEESIEESIEESEDSEWKPTKKVKKNKDNKKTVKTVKKENSKKVSEEDDVLINKLKNALVEQKDSGEDVISMLKDLQSRNKNNVLVNECLKVCEKKIVVNKKKQEHKIKREKERNGRIFKRILRDKNTMNDFDFYDKLEMDNQKKIIKELREINKITRIEKPYRLTLLESDIPVKFKSAAMKKISSIRHMEPGSGEYYKIKNWVDAFMRIPFNKYENLPISITDGVERCHDFMAKAQKTLDEAVYGLNDAKMQIMQMLGQLITNPDSIGSAIAIHGPPGTGKCHTFDTPILMYDGSTKMVQDIVVGDKVMGDDSTPRNVIDLGRGEDELYEIIPKKGEKFGVNSEHILCLKQSGLNRIRSITNKNDTISYKVEYLNNLTYKIQSKRINNYEEAKKYLYEKNIENDILEISVKDLLLLPKNIYNKLKGYRTGVEFETKHILFDPYILGVWLGDGTTSKPEITNQDAAILCYIRTSIKKNNLNLNYYSGYTYRIAYDMPDNDSRNNKNVFLQVLKDYNLLNNKHIPNEFKFNDRNVRLQTLAGILDTDGSYSQKDKCFDIIQKSKRLSDDIIFIARSLGFAAYQKKCNKSCFYKGNKITGEYYRIIISGDNLCEIPTKCPRKKAIERQTNKNAMVFGFDIKSIGIGNYYGFTLDNNHRYLLHDFTVTHNTSLVKEGISKILNRPFAFIALGGATDSSFLEGHGYTYEGSTWGKIVQILIDSKCMNPVIYFDELDKISDTPKGEEIAGILTHLTDTSQNTQFHDKYFTEIDFDLSKCLFIFSYNDESKVNPILKDRMYRIQTKGYNQKQKTAISNNYLLPKIREQVKFAAADIIIPDQTLHYIIENYCNKEDGVRNLKRCLEIIYTKLNLYRLMRPGSNLFEEDMSIKVEFPFTVTKDIVEKMIKKTGNGLDPSLQHLYI